MLPKGGCYLETHPIRGGDLAGGRPDHIYIYIYQYVPGKHWLENSGSTKHQDFHMVEKMGKSTKMQNIIAEE